MRLTIVQTVEVDFTYRQHQLGTAAHQIEQALELLHAAEMNLTPVLANLAPFENAQAETEHDQDNFNAVQDVYFEAQKLRDRVNVALRALSDTCG